VQHEIAKGWIDKKGVLGIRIHKLLDNSSNASVAGADPFVNVGNGSLSGIAPLKDPAGYDSKAVYATIAGNIERWIDEAVEIRNLYK
jgi:hypothetical protein